MTSSAGSIEPEYITADDYLEDDELEVVHGDHGRSRACSAGDGIRFIFTSFVDNFAGFSVVAVIFVAMIGVGVAEAAGLMAALIRKLVAVAAGGSLTFIIMFVGGLSSVATDAGYLILIPLGRGRVLSASGAIRSPASPPPTPA